MPKPHSPRRTQAPEVTLLPGAIVCDVATGQTLSSDDWLAARAEREGRTRDECVDELMNAISRGDLVVEGG
ncbi:MAG: hypothetical protein GIX03_06890 [Candidatus Eremiobacteraeota bacterium]|nr:hypothetical protein [Candidatus Eremiobacteraeota bacterium]MBC5802719.1 hypothetical protein [Candidatus Eremiobacteraeota bacterium]MBC5821567.1 hypothetical protein [Candidatus Eremiobacteraeota bacterium]